MGAGVTVMVEVAVCPMASCTVMMVVVFVATLLASSTTVEPLTACVTGKAVELLEKA